MFWLLACLIMAAVLSPELFRWLRKKPLTERYLSSLGHRLTVIDHGNGLHKVRPGVRPLLDGEEICCSHLTEKSSSVLSKHYDAQVCGKTAAEFWVARDVLDGWHVVGYCGAHSFHARCECEWPSGYCCTTQREAMNLLAACQVMSS